MIPTVDDVYEWVVGFIESHGYCPTVREVAAGTKCSLVTVFGRLKKLEGQGRLASEERQGRTIRPIDRPVTFDLRKEAT